MSTIDDTIAHYAEELPLILDELDGIKDLHDDFRKMQRTVFCFMLFVTVTMMDSMVASKYLILADIDYDQRFMRGKLMVILNEGFKKLYGFDKRT